MSELLSVPLKKPSDVEVAKPLKNLIQLRYSTADKPEDYSEAINEFAKLRPAAIWRAFEKYESSLEVLYSYYDQVVALESKIPPQEVQVPFKWKDAFDKGSIFGGKISLTVASLSYEKVCLLFNIAALQSSVAAGQSVENDDGLKLAAKLLQNAAGIFSQLKSTVMLLIQQDPTPDLNPDTLGALSALMLAQAQEIFVHKAIHDNMKDNIVAKLAAQCEELYAECYKMCNRDSLKTLWDRDWLPMINGKQCAFKAISEFYQSLVCKNNQEIGKEIAWLEHSLEMFRQAQAKSGRVIFQDLMNKASRNLTEVKKDNDFIYHERIPDLKSLEPIGKVQLAKILPVAQPMSQNFKDLFEELVPVAVHQAMTAFDIRKNEIVNTEITRLRESTQVLNSTLASLNLPAAIESTEGNTLPPSILEKADSVKNLGGLVELEKLINDLPELLKRNQDILDEADRMLDEEKKADDALKEQFKERWTRTPSDKLTEMFKSNSAKYRQIINNAVTADRVVREKFETQKPFMELLSKPNDEISAVVPSSGGNEALNSSAVSTLRLLMEEVETIKAERDVIESEIKSATADMKATFLQALVKDGAINEPAMSVENIGQIYGPLQGQVRDNLKKQEGLIEKIQKAHAEFVQDRGSSACGREKMMCQLAGAYDAFTDIQNNLREGTKFYNDLTQLLVVFQNKISDYCFARKTEKEELLKDLTQESSRQAPAPTPSQPSYHSDPSVRKEAPPRPPQPNPGSAPPQQQQSNLPYPVYVQGMPVPYGASTSTPYPSYVAPPMPQGYNPYGTMPYPTSYNYPGGFPQGPPNPNPNANYPQQPQGFPQQPPPGGYPYQQPPQWQ